MSDLNYSGIYEIANTVNGKSYFGSAVNLRKRWNHHRRLLRCGTHHNPPLQAAWKKYGENAFDFRVIEPVEDRTQLIAREQVRLDSLQKGCYYNICLKAGSTLGAVVSEETRKKISASKIGKTNGQLGMKRTPEQVARIAAGQLGKKMSVEAIEKTRAAHIGRKNSPETILRMKAAALKRWEQTK